MPKSQHYSFANPATVSATSEPIDDPVAECRDASNIARKLQDQDLALKKLLDTIGVLEEELTPILTDRAAPATENPDREAAYSRMAAEIHEFTDAVWLAVGKIRGILYRLDL